MSIVTKTMRVADIKVGNRVRADLGNIGELADSIKAHGLFHPPTVDAADCLAAGRRRLEAVKLLGWDEVDVRVVVDLADMREVLAIERDENSCRKSFTPSEAVEMSRRIEELEKPKAEARRREGNARGGRKEVGADSAPTSDPAPKTRDVAAAAAGMGHDTLRKAKAVVDAAEDEAAAEAVRAAAREAKAEMDASGNVEAAHRKTQRAIADHIAEARPDIVDFHLATEAGKAVRKFKTLIKGVDPERAGTGRSSQEHLDLHLVAVDECIGWLTTYRRNLKPLRVAEAQ